MTRDCGDEFGEAASAIAADTGTDTDRDGDGDGWRHRLWTGDVPPPCGSTRSGW